MKITIKDEQSELIVSNDQLDNPNFVDITINEGLDGQNATITVLLDDIFPALMAFQAQRTRIEERELIQNKQIN